MTHTSAPPKPDGVLIAHIALAGLLLLVAAAMMWSQPILADDWDFFRAIYDWQNSRARIPHPHAYVHLAQLGLAIFGESTSNARIPGVLSGLLNLVLIPLLVYTMFGRTRRTRNIAIIAIWLYALNPATAQNMMLLDIDNTILTPALLGLLWVWKVTPNSPSWQRILALGGSLGLCLWAKIPTPILLIGCIGLWHLLRGQFRHFFDAILATGVGIGGFLATFTLYCQLTGFRFEYLVRTFKKAPSVNNLSTMLVRFPQGFGVFVLWLSLPLAILLAIVYVKALLRILKRQPEDHDLWLLYIGITTLFYALTMPPAWGYPKYQTPLLPLTVILVARLLVPVFERLPRKALLVIAGLGLAVFVYKLGVVGDPFYALYQVTFESDLADLSVRMARGLEALVQLTIPLGVALALGYGLARLWSVQPGLILIAVLGALALADPASTTAVQVSANYSTRYRYTYDYDDLRQVIADLQAADPDYILAVMDVLYYYGDWEGEMIYYKYVCANCPPQNLLDAIYSRRIDALVWTTKEANRSPNVVQDPEVRQTLDACYTRREYGVFIVHLRKPDAPCP